LPGSRGEQPVEPDTAATTAPGGTGGSDTKIPENTTPPSSSVPTPEAQDDAPVPVVTIHRSLSTATVLAVVGIGVALLVLAYFLTVIGLKRRRRRRRRSAADPHVRAVGAFTSGVDLLVDLGARTRRSMTDRELVHVGRSTLGDVADHLEIAARVATESVYGDELSNEDTDRAWAEIVRFEEEAADQVGRWRHLRAICSARSLRLGLAPERERADR
jgi:hypothetical protein